MPKGQVVAGVTAGMVSITWDSAERKLRVSLLCRHRSTIRARHGRPVRPARTGARSADLTHAVCGKCVHSSPLSSRILPMERTGYVDAVIGRPDPGLWVR